MTIQEAYYAIYSAIETGDSIDDHEILILAEKALSKQMRTKVIQTRESCGIPFGKCPCCGKEINKFDDMLFHDEENCLQRLEW